MIEHRYELALKWTGNKGEGTASYRSYNRDYTISFDGKTELLGSSDPSFRGDQSRYNPEELLVASLSSCHMLWFLHLCADHGIVVTAYTDQPKGKMIETKEGGHFEEVSLYPKVSIKVQHPTVKLNDLHEQAHKLCFIANSVNFEVKCEASEQVEA